MRRFFSNSLLKKLLILPFMFLGSMFLWWLTGGSKQQISASARVPASAAQEEHTPSPRDIKFATAPSPKSGLLLYDPVTVTPCNIVPSQEQNISSQVDGILEHVFVDLGHQVTQGQQLAQLDDHQVRAQAELLKIRALSESAQRIAQAQQDEAESKVAYAIKANENGLIAVPELEFKTYVLQRERFAQEVKKAREEQEIARKELEKICVTLDQHQIKSGIAGEVVKVYKRPGEAVRQAEPLFRIANCERIRIEGLCKVQQADLLRVGMTALVEPELRGEQLTELAGHTAPITSVAISADGRLLASGSEDRTVILWGWPQGNRLCLLPHPAEVGAVSFAPSKNPGDDSQLLTGAGDGQARLWRISADGTVKSPMLFAQAHEGAIRALAFSRDGAWCATGGEDKRIGIWEAFTGKHLYWVETEDGASSVHKGAVTSLSFTADGHLVSAGRDNCLRVWQVDATSARLIDQISGRTGEVTQFSVSPDGNQVLFDHGEELRLLDRRSWDALGSFRGQRQGRFTGLAHFSPSGKLVLTAATSGRIQLWKAPTFTAQTERSLIPSNYEVRYFASPNAIPVTCGAFAPDEKVIFTGGVDKVIRVWPVPPERDWDPLEAKITYIGTQVERGTDTLRLRAEMDNPQEPGRRLRPGTFATLKIYPSYAK